MTLKNKDSQKAGLAGYSKAATRRQPQKDIPAKLKPDNEDDAHSTLSSGSAGKSSSSKEAFARLEEEFEQAKLAWAQEKQILYQKELLQEQDRQGLLQRIGNYHTQLQTQSEQIRELQEHMSKTADLSSTSTKKTSNVVTGQKSTTFASPASFSLAQGSTTHQFSPLGTTPTQTTINSPTGSNPSQLGSGFTTPANPHHQVPAPSPFTHPAQPGHYWSQYVHSSGQVL